MSKEVVSILVSAGGSILAVAILAALRGATKVAKAIRDNTAAVTRLSADLASYIHGNDTEKAVMKQDIHDLKEWRLRSESTNRAAAVGKSDVQ